MNTAHVPKPHLYEGYGWCDLANPQWIAVPPVGHIWSLGDVWREVRGVAHIGIVRLSDDHLIYHCGWHTGQPSRPYPPMEAGFSQWQERWNGDAAT